MERPYASAQFGDAHEYLYKCLFVIGVGAAAAVQHARTLRILSAPISERVALLWEAQLFGFV